MDWLRLRHRIPPPPPLATLTNPHPSFSVTEDRVLNLRETGSQIVIQTIENALRQGGLALLGEGFQLDSSLSYHSGDNEGIEGDLDVVIPLLNLGEHVVFAQPGAVFWTGLEEEERIDGNIGLVYRAELTRDLVAGASVFYDHDFQIGHSRVSGGIDLQSGFFLFGANYYHVLSEIEDGREGFVEEAVDGMDARLVFEREDVRLGSTIGYWDYEGEENPGGENSQSGWKTSIGMDFGFRVLPGVFIEGSWERHKDDLVLDERIFAGLAFRFSLPDFEGGSYAGGEMSSNLYKIVDREKRILYEERESDGILLIPDGNVVEGGTVNVAIQLRKPSAEDVVINLAGSGSATYGTDGDYTVSVGGTDCTAFTETGCSITIAAGETYASDNVMIAINPDGRGEGEETIILSTTVASGDTSLTGRPLVLMIPEDPPLARASLVRSGSEVVAEGSTIALDIQLGEMLDEDVTINLVGSDSTATYGSSSDWTLSVGGTVCTGVANNECPVSITAGQTGATDDVVITINDDGRTNELAENIVLSTTVDSGSTHLLQAGSPFTLTIPADPPLPTVSLSTDSTSTSVTEGNTATITLTLSETLGSDATFNLVGGGAATYGTSADWNLSVGGTDCASASQSSPCEVTIAAGDTTAEATIEINTDSTAEAREDFTVSVAVDSGSTSLVVAGSSSNLSFNIPDHRPTVSLNYSGPTTLVPGASSLGRMTVALSESLGEAITISLTSSGTASYGRVNDFHVVYNIIPSGGTPPDTFDINSSTNCNALPCQIIIPAGQTIIDLRVQVFDDFDDPPTGDEDFTFSVSVASAGSTGLVVGSSSSVMITIDN